MRLTEFEVQAIIQTFHELFFEPDHLWLFGSRIDDSQKGGDIDLYIECHESDPTKLFNLKIEFLMKLEAKIGEQKVDLVISSPKYDLPIYRHAKETGICLV